jgi:hypothetical protein
MHFFTWTLPTVNFATPSKDNLDLFKDGIHAAGRKRYQNGHRIPWWTRECKATYRV